MVVNDAPGARQRIALRTGARRLRLLEINRNVDVEKHLDAVVESLRIVLAADESIRTGEVVRI